VKGLLARLVDDAGLFPPEQLPMGEALARHWADEMSPSPGRSMLTHRFLCPASRLGELRAEPGLQRWTVESGRPGLRSAPGGPGLREGPGLRDGPGVRLRLGLIVDTGLDGLAAARAEAARDPRLLLELVEVPAPSNEAVTSVLEAVVGVDTAVYIEGPREPGWVKTVGVWQGPGGLRGAKVRCGGARAELFPSPEELAAFLCACAEVAVNFKATAGLHGAVRHRDDRTGFTHHGFLNLVLGTARAAAKAPLDDVADVLRATDEAALVAEARAVSGRVGSLTRAMFRAYGSCSTAEPQEEAARLGLLELA
jgi:hypothetical protein